MAMTKIDLMRESRELYLPPRDPVMVEVPEFTFMMIDGHGDPDFATREAIESLYALAYTLKFAAKRGPQELDYKVMPLEGLWWMPDMTEFSLDRKDEWDWTLMIRVPETIGQEMLEEARGQAMKRKELPAAPEIRLEQWEEGLCAQLMHVGPYSAEGPSVARLHAFIAEQGCELAGKHHEIYLGDPRRSAPAKLRTVLRQQIRSR